MKFSREKIIIMVVSTLFALVVLTIPFSYTYVASTYFLGASLFIPSVQLMTWSSEPFDAQKWQNAEDIAGRTTRGNMLKDLLRTKDIARMTDEEIVKLLGKPNGYLNYDHIISYVVEQNGETYMLGFSNGTVLLQKW